MKQSMLLASVLIWGITACGNLPENFNGNESKESEKKTSSSEKAEDERGVSIEEFKKGYAASLLNASRQDSATAARIERYDAQNIEVREAAAEAPAEDVQSYCGGSDTNYDDNGEEIQTLCADVDESEIDEDITHDGDIICYVSQDGQEEYCENTHPVEVVCYVSDDGMEEKCEEIDIDDVNHHPCQSVDGSPGMEDDQTIGSDDKGEDALYRCGDGVNYPEPIYDDCVYVAYPENDDGAPAIQDTCGDSVIDDTDVRPYERDLHEMLSMILEILDKVLVMSDADGDGFLNAEEQKKAQSLLEMLFGSIDSNDEESGNTAANKDEAASSKEISSAN